MSENYTELLEVVTDPDSLAGYLYENRSRAKAIIREIKQNAGLKGAMIQAGMLGKFHDITDAVMRGEDPRKGPGANQEPPKVQLTTEEGVIKAADNAHKIKIPGPQAISAAELLSMDLPPIQWIVKDLLPRCTAFLVAPSKSGKSWLALQLALDVCRGRPFLGKFETVKCGVLYCDLESGKRRPRDRIKKLLNGEPVPENLYLLTAENDVRKLTEGFAEQIRMELIKHEDIGMVIVDVLQVVKPAGKRNKNAYENDYDVMAEISKIKTDREVGVFLVHHTRKGRDKEDIFNNISGSTGLMGSADEVMMLERQRNSADASISITGRDVEEQKYSLKVVKGNGIRFEYRGTADEIEAQQELEEYQNSPVIATIKKLLRQSSDGRWEGSADDIRQASKYLGSAVYDDSRKVGKEIRRFEGLLWAQDGITMDSSRTAKSRIYTFVLGIDIQALENDLDTSHMSAMSQTSATSQTSLSDYMDM